MRDAKHLLSAADYAALVADSQVLRQFKAQISDRLVMKTGKAKTLPGFSYPAGRMVDFTIDTQLLLSDGSYNLRETVNCPETWFNTRMRAALQAVEMHEGPEAKWTLRKQL